MTVVTDLAPATETEVAAILSECHARRRPVRILGGGTRVENRTLGEPLSLSRLSGVVTYSPGEMTLIARPGTPLPQILAMLAAENQTLAFEPPDMRAILGRSGTPTLGGMVAANAGGPRRILAGACRDHLLGVRFVDGQGRILKNGGRVMKNVTGLDLSKLLAGSHGTLGVLTEVALKTLPLSPARTTLAFPGVDDTTALRIFTAALSTPYDVSGAAHVGGTAYLRIEGLDGQRAYRRDRLLALLAEYRPEVVDDAPWDAIRDVTHFVGGGPLWRILCRPTDAPGLCAGLRAMGGDCSLDWGGGLIWYRGPGHPRALAPHATLIRRADAVGPAFPPLPGAVARIQDGLRRSFDPAGILNPGLMASDATGA
ncbi:FAD-binding protein [Paracoccus sediminis]|uniref:FAD-binding protein n=1 Tax=Paracoccus sediminis TaxID=1214787 RepID=A0A238VEW1_9RHOB|nr:FAD-binding protein [Paracoccus sediminis]TBN52011.1 FAD-binding protein [Paracoccus sediminis]SNR32935.1 glycolate oxidase FAD binding subunit [Paracoccus sediminis]